MDHSHDHSHDNHGGGHSHDHHDHSHGEGEYYLNQLLTVFICGAFGVVAILLFQTLNVVDKDGEPKGMITKLLAEQFRLPVLIGGIALLAIVALRGVLLWQAAGDAKNSHSHSHDHHHHHHGHNHKPGEKCDHPDHKHEHCDDPNHQHTESCGHHHGGHDHSDHSAADHEHGNVYWRVVLLGFPIFLFTMGVPSKGFSPAWIRQYIGEEEALVSLKGIASEKVGSALYDFKSLNELSKNEESRQSLIGTRAMLKGQFSAVNTKEFSLVFLSMVCCATDNEPLRARIIVQSDSQISGFLRQAYPWVQVNGIISEFVKSPKSGDWVAIIRIDEKGSVTGIDGMN